MTLKRAHYGFIALLIGLFLTFQISASAHTAEFGDAPHEHDGISCVITNLAENDQGVLPVAPENFAVPGAIEFNWQESFTSAANVTNPSRAPPPRGPPALIQ